MGIKGVPASCVIVKTTQINTGKALRTWLVQNKHATSVSHYWYYVMIINIIVSQKKPTDRKENGPDILVHKESNKIRNEVMRILTTERERGVVSTPDAFSIPTGPANFIRFLYS